MSYFWGYLDHLPCQSLGLSSPVGGLFRRVPSGPSSLLLSRLRGSVPGTSCTAAGRCGRPLCCHGFPPECWGLGVTQGKRSRFFPTNFQRVQGPEGTTEGNVSLGDKRSTVFNSSSVSCLVSCSEYTLFFITSNKVVGLNQWEGTTVH